MSEPNAYSICCNWCIVGRAAQDWYPYNRSRKSNMLEAVTASKRLCITLCNYVTKDTRILKRCICSVKINYCAEYMFTTPQTDR